MLLKGKTAVITGSNKGIGLKTLEIFSENGATIFACARNINVEFNDLIKNLGLDITNYSLEEFIMKLNELSKSENSDTKHAISEMKSAMDQMDDIFIPSIRKIAKSTGVELN